MISPTYFQKAIIKINEMIYENVCVPFSVFFKTDIVLRFLNLLFSFFPKLHLKDKKRFEKANQDAGPGLNLEEFIAFEHPEEVDYMTVRSKFNSIIE